MNMAAFCVVVQCSLVVVVVVVVEVVNIYQTTRSYNTEDSQLHEAQ